MPHTYLIKNWGLRIQEPMSTPKPTTIDAKREGLPHSWWERFSKHSPDLSLLFTPLCVGGRCILVPTPTRSRQAPKVCLFLEFSISKIPDPESYPPSWPLSVRRGMFFFPVLIYSSMPVKSRVEKRVLFVGESLGHPDNKQGQARSWPLPHPSLQIAHCPHFCVPSQLSSVSVWRLFSLDLKKKKKICFGTWRGEVSTAEDLVTASGTSLATGSSMKAGPGPSLQSRPQPGPVVGRSGSEAVCSVPPRPLSLPLRPRSSA